MGPISERSGPPCTVHAVFEGGKMTAFLTRNGSAFDDYCGPERSKSHNGPQKMLKVAFFVI